MLITANNGTFTQYHYQHKQPNMHPKGGKANPTHNRTLIILILGALMTVSPFSIDMYLPAFTQIANSFGTTAARISLSVSSYFIGLGIGQLLYGPLLDRFGRKKPLYFGLGLYLLACIGCMQSQTEGQLITMRFIQGLGGCVAMVAAIAMVRDFFPVGESAKILSLLMLVLGLSPLLAPTLGGFVTAGLGWHWVFIILAIIVALILLVTAAFLPHANDPDPTVSLKPKPIIKAYWAVLPNPSFYVYTIAGAFSFAALFVYVAGSPVIFMGIFRASPQAYGGIFALLSVSFIGSNQLNILLLRRFSSSKIFRGGLLLQLAVSVLFLLAAANNWLGLPGTIIMFFAALACIGLTYPNASAMALAPFSRNAGTAAALTGFVQIGVAALASACTGFFNATNMVPIIAMLPCTSLIACATFFALSKKIKA